MNLDAYRGKRRFQTTPEPVGTEAPAPAVVRRFVVQKHAARNLHYDFRLELRGVLKSWAVPKGPSLDPTQKRLAVEVEDHPLEYATFEGTIPAGEYGGGTVQVWDHGTWTPEGDPAADLRDGLIKFSLHGAKLTGRWMLVRMKRKDGERRDNWLLVKERDAAARPLSELDVLLDQPASVLTGRTVSEITADARAAPVEPDPPKKKARPRAAQKARVHPLATEPQARPAALPAQIDPQRAKPADAPPDGDAWLHEIKFDGYRIVAFLDDGRVTLRTRTHIDWTARFPELVHSLRTLRPTQAVLDGELVALLPNGASSFAALQTTLTAGRTGDLVYFVFDLLHLDGYDLRDVPLLRRKELLREFLATGTSSRVQYADHLVGDGPHFFEQCRRTGLEGCVSKRVRSVSRPGRGPDWLKIKCVHRDEFVIGGFTDSTNRRGLRALLIGRFGPDGRLRYEGKVGSGFSEQALEDLRERLQVRRQAEQPFSNLAAKDVDRGTHWVRPELVAQIEYAGRVGEGLLFHPVFQGLREDLPAADVRGESSGEKVTKGGALAKSPRKSAPAQRVESAGERLSPAELEELQGIRFTHPERLLYPESGITKLQLATYYVQISDWILPHIVDRPIHLVRCPDGLGGQTFYQKHATQGMSTAIRRVEIATGDEKNAYLAIHDLAGLLSLVQVGTLELHPWGARCDDPDKPDRVTFDLDPDAAVNWTAVIDLAREFRQRLADLGLVSFVKTTGGKGLHVVVPLQRRQTWDDVKRFARRLADQVAADAPQKLTTNPSKQVRPGKIYIDHLRNRKEATAVAAYSTRARPGAPVATPLAWDELAPDLRSDHFHIGNLPERLAALRADPWAELPTVRQWLTKKHRR